MELNFEEEATREQLWLRGFFMGPTGSGKSEGSLMLASRLMGGGIPITLINTERGRGRLYADRYKYGLIDMSGDDGGEVEHSPEEFVRAIDLAEKQRPGATLIIDSGSHEWMGKNGVLQQADKFGEWKTVRPKHQDWVDRLMAYQGHVIVCVRAKMKYEVSEEEVPGRSKPRQVIQMLGVGPIQDGDLQYEFNLVGRFDQATKEVTWSGHVEHLQGTISNLREDSDRVADVLSKWLAEGDPIEPPEAASEEAVAELVASLKEEGHKDDVIEERFSVQRRKNRGALHPDYVAEQLAKSKERLADKEKDKKPEPEPAAA